MALFGRRKEPLHERLLREAGIDAGRIASEPELADDTQGLPADPFAWRFTDAESRAATPRPREWDASVMVRATGIEGDSVAFTVVDADTLLVDEEEGDANLSPLADAVERRLSPPYRARAARQGDDLWAVTARTIQVARLDAEGETIDLASHRGEQTVAVDGEPARGSYPALEGLGAQAGPDYAVHAERIDGDLWEVAVTPL